VDDHLCPGFEKTTLGISDQRETVVGRRVG
jgi:hypothetical protein